MKRHDKKVKNLIIMCALMGIILTVSTYAWFSALKTVNVSTFNVNIKTTDSLLLSLTANGSDWAETVTINEENYKTAAYPGNTNSWGGLGLIPMSSIGEIDPQSSTMKLYEKASLTATPNKGELLTAGGYRLLASRVPNHNNQLSEEHDGYVAFDLFIRNFSGEAYYKENDYGIQGNEEAIYLTTNSVVDVGLSGVKNTGIENSVRVAFAEIGRVDDLEEDQDIITGITCVSDDKVTGICRDAAIWEPNDDKHVQNAINWYNLACMERTGENVNDSSSYGINTCHTINEIKDGEYYPTFAIANEITPGVTPNVDIYDGYYNGYNDTGSYFDKDKPLYAVETFADFDKMQRGTDRKEIFYLAPNSITKVRVYVWIEGQDIDNYDFASLGKSISVGFGFEKERFTLGEIDGTETEPTIDDTVPPTQPLSLTARQVDNSVKLMANGSTDNIKVKGYKYSSDNENWSSLVRPNSLYELNNIEPIVGDVPIYAKAIDLAGNESPVYMAYTTYAYNDDQPPTRPTLVSVRQDGNNLKIKASGSTDNGALKGYKFSIDPPVTPTNMSNGNLLRIKPSMLMNTYTPKVTKLANNDRVWTTVLFEENEEYEISVSYERDTTFTVYAKAIDVSGNESSETSTTYRFIYHDNISPSMPSTINFSQNVNTLIVTASGSTDNIELAGYKYSLDNTNWSSILAPGISYELPNASDNDKTFTVYTKAVDTSGNESSVKTASFNFKYNDFIAPSIPTTLTVSQSGLTLVMKASGSTDNIGVTGYKFSIDNINWSGTIAANTNYTTASLTNSDKTYTVYVKATDAAGNLSNAKTTTINFVHMDLTAPGKPTGMQMLQVSGGIQLKAVGSTDDDSGLAGYRYSKDNTNWTATVASGTATTISGATTSNTFYVKAIDKAGNLSAAYSDKITINNYSYTGGVQTFTTPKAGKYILEVWGAQGGNNGGKGGYSKGTMTLTASKKLYVVVGQQGAKNGSKAYNGGGAGNGGGYAGDGGGATHIATATGVLSSLSSNRGAIIIVAGGGGGTSEQGHVGGAGGGTSGSNGSNSGYYYGYGGTQTAGGGSRDGVAHAGSFGQGGAAEDLESCSETRRYGGGGGGGYFGGGGGGYQCTSTNGDGGGGGGSGYVNTTYLSSTSMSNGSRSGNGYATITYTGNY